MGSDKTESTIPAEHELPRATGLDRADWVSLLVAKPDGPKMVLLLEGQPLIVGRGRAADVDVDSTDISRRHASFTLSDGQVWVEDLGSTNGTLVGGQKITRQVIREADEVVMGSVVAAIHSSRAAQVDPTAPQPSGPGASADELSMVWGEAMEPIHAMVTRLASLALPVLIYGETGAGKELVARAIHDQGDRKGKPLIFLNCAAIPGNLIESLLFGHEQGAFTGAHRRKKGVFEEAHGGTLFLDEIGELAAEAQSSLLRVLETKRLTRVGSVKEIEVDVRIIAATHQDLEQMCEVNTFRWDLFYRLNTMVLEIPPLRDRVEEIPLLAEHFIARANRANACDVNGISDAAIAALRGHRWPGNVRELRNVIERAVVIVERGAIDVDHLPPRLREGHDVRDRFALGSQQHSRPTTQLTSVVQPGPTLDFRGRVQRCETALILDALRKTQGNKAETSQLLGIPPRTLSHKIRLYGIEAAGGPSLEQAEIHGALEEINAAVAGVGLDFKGRLQAYEASLIRRALREARGNKTEAARLLSIPLRTVTRKVQIYGLAADDA